MSGLPSEFPATEATTQTPGERFQQRLAAWRVRHRSQGATQAYPYAWRLPELARPLGREALSQAQHALALTLYELGRFAEARAALPEPAADPDLTLLQARCLCLLGEAAAGLQLARALPTASPGLAHLHFLLDDADATLAALAAGPAAPDDAGEAPWTTLLRGWAGARRGLVPDEGGMQRALAELRALAPALAAQGAALHAEARFHQGPCWALTWLDDALALGDGHGQHHLKARLLGLKARALAADGRLGEAGRFQRLAQDLARRQGALLYLAPGWT